ncbi:hypothetical protein LP420_19180 [Massilia sp. B-10]|nr:hypothetical protein LP420_19180 [Massilia sp. B-10]
MCGIAMTVSVLVGAHFGGLRGVSLVWLLVYPVLSVKLLYDVCRITGLTMSEYYRSLLPVLAAAVAMALVVLAVRTWMLTLGVPTAVTLVAEIMAKQDQLRALDRLPGPARHERNQAGADRSGHLGAAPRTLAVQPD